MSRFPKIMGILNVTPDSFSDGGEFLDTSRAISHALGMLENGADIIDVGGESTRPGAGEIDAEEEIKRVLPVIDGIKRAKPDAWLSIDTTKVEVAERAADAGAEIVNDVSALSFDPAIGELCAEKNLGLVLMHMQGNPRNMQKEPHYDNVVEDVFAELSERIAFARSLGVRSIIADVGIGFGKTVEHNLELLRNHKRFLELGVPLLLGISRKSFIGHILDIETAGERDLPTILFHSLLLDSGAEIIRVHNVENAVMLRKCKHALDVDII